MGIEAGGNKNHLRGEFIQCRQPGVFHGGAEFRAAAIGRKRNIYHSPRTSLSTAIGVKRVLERRNHHHSLIGMENVFGSVAMVYVEIHDRNAFKPVRFNGVGRTHSDIVEKAKAHGTPAAGVMSRWPQDRKSTR